jgi:hypothetical protein
VIPAIIAIWLLAGVQVLLFIVWCLVSQRATSHLTVKGGIIIVLLWPDIIAGLIREARS